MVDRERLTALLRRLASDVGYLRARADGDRAALRADEERLSGLKYRFVTALETVVSIAQHLSAGQGWGPPESNAASVRLLGRHGVIEQELANRLGSAVGFRNVLVHEYAQVDDDLAVAQLDEVGDLAAFLVATTTWLRDTADR